MQKRLIIVVHTYIHPHARLRVHTHTGLCMQVPAHAYADTHVRTPTRARTHTAKNIKRNHKEQIKRKKKREETVKARGAITKVTYITGRNTWQTITSKKSQSLLRLRVTSWQKQDWEQGKDGLQRQVSERPSP